RSHGSSAGEHREYDDVVAWHVEHFADVVARLKETPDVDGSWMLDNAVIMMGTEGGHGFDPESGTYGGSHSSENMSLLVAGGRHLGLKPGRHIHKNNDAHPAAVIRTAMKAVGVDAALGAVTADVPELRG